MGKLNFFKRKKEINEQNEIQEEKQSTQEIQKTQESKTPVETKLEEEKVDIKSPADRKTYVSQKCEQIIEATKQMDEFRKEYDLVTAYLSDIQVIDQIPEGSRNEIDDAARNILMLTRERNKYQNGESKITQKQYRLLESYEDEIPDEVKKINKKEAYQSALKKDIAILEGEKNNLYFEQSEVKEKQKFLKLTSIVVCVLTTIMFLVIAGLSSSFHFDFKVPFILTVLLALVCAAFIANDARRIKIEHIQNQRKISKAIGLLNTTKIKYVNNQLSLDYSYAKFSINSSMQLTLYWNEYVKQKEMNEKYKNNTELLNYYSEKLIKVLKNYHLHDADVWVHQALALLEPKEMVEIRHRLNIRRQKLRDRMDYNVRAKEESVEKINEVLRKNTDAKDEIVETLKKYHINL